MGDEVPPIHIEVGATARPEEGSGMGDGLTGTEASSRRVVHEPGRWTRTVALVVLAGLAAGSLLVVLRGGVRDPREAGPDERTPAEAARDAYATAIGRLGRAGSFAYHGTVQAPAASPLRPGTWIGSPVTVDGAVLLPHDITREVASTASGAAVETVTSGRTAWTHSGADAADLADAPWEVIAAPDPVPARPPFPEVPAPNRLGIALVVDVLRSAGDRRRGPPDAGGRRSLHATVPDDERYGELLMGAEVSLVLDDAGDITHLVLTAPDDGVGLAVDLEIERLGESGLITPEDVGDPVRRAMPVEAIEAAGIRALDLDRLPPGWALTGAREARADPVLMCRFGGCSRPRESCPSLSLDYRDLTAELAGRLSLLVMSQSCLARQGGGLPWREPFQAGTYAGRAEKISGSTMGTVSNGVTAVGFSTDLSTADAAVVLASLVPFDASADPGSLAGIPSS